MLLTMPSFTPPFPLRQWIDEHRHLLRPPVGNQQIYKGNKDFVVMVVGGPNRRKDFHVNRGEELFFQLEGDIELQLMTGTSEGKPVREIVHVREGEMFLLPAGIPHGPRRGPGTVGLVIERYRVPGETDGFEWYCENCSSLLYRMDVPVSDIVTDLPALMEDFFNTPDRCTCRKCGVKMEKP